MVAEGTAVGCGVSVGPGVSVSSGVAVAEGDAPGLGEGDLFLRFRFVSGVGLGDGVGEIFFRFGEAVGEGLGEDFLAGRFRCFRVGVAVGVASKTFLIFVPNDSSALPGTTFVPKQIAATKRLRRTILVAGNKISGPAPVELPCSVESRLRDFPEGNSRWVSAPCNLGAPVPSGASRRPGCCETPRQSGCCPLLE